MKRLSILAPQDQARPDPRDVEAYRLALAGRTIWCHHDTVYGHDLWRGPARGRNFFYASIDWSTSPFVAGALTRKNVEIGATQLVFIRKAEAVRRGRAAACREGMGDEALTDGQLLVLWSLSAEEEVAQPALRSVL